VSELEDLRDALVERFGLEPNFVVTYNRYESLIPDSYGFFLAYDAGTVAMKAVRDAVEQLSARA